MILYINTYTFSTSNEEERNNEGGGGGRGGKEIDFPSFYILKNLLSPSLNYSRHNQIILSNVYLICAPFCHKPDH